MHKINFNTVANPPEGQRFHYPEYKSDWKDVSFPMHIFDAQGQLNEAKLGQIRDQFNKTGALHIINSGLDADPEKLADHILHGLGFGHDEQFKWGGNVSGRTNLKTVSPAMRDTDDYPKDLFLLPHNEILYQHSMPLRLMFFCEATTQDGHGGRTFVHSAKRVEDYIRNCGPEGEQLLEKMEAGGFTIITGFLDEDHPQKDQNYFRSWQERFGTKCLDQALNNCKAASDQFDECWWKEEVDGDRVFHTLMTTINIPAFKVDERDGERYMLFPRIALDEPTIYNGYRRYLIGPDDEELTKTETAILLQAFLQTREGRYYKPTDILLVDNIKYGHGRESYEGSRKVYASMAGQFKTDALRPV
tara:strand:+ start:173927 stop:175006 length:1080 start_codon:yes stop_codon:yes gene_type:complete